MTPSSPTVRTSASSSTMTEKRGGSGSVSIACRVMRASTRRLTSSGPTLAAPAMKAVAYSLVCSSPGTTKLLCSLIAEADWTPPPRARRDRIYKDEMDPRPLRDGDIRSVGTMRRSPRRPLQVLSPTTRRSRPPRTSREQRSGSTPSGNPTTAAVPTVSILGDRDPRPPVQPPTAKPSRP